MRAPRPCRRTRSRCSTSPPSGAVAATAGPVEAVEVASSRPELRGATRVVSGGRGPRVEGEVRARRRARRCARRCRRCVQSRRRRGIHPAVAPGRSDRRLGVSAAVCRSRHLGCDPAPRGQCRPPRTSSRSTRTRRHRSSTSPTSASSGTCSRWSEGDRRPRGAEEVVMATRMLRRGLPRVPGGEPWPPGRCRGVGCGGVGCGGGIVGRTGRTGRRRRCRAGPRGGDDGCCRRGGRGRCPGRSCRLRLSTPR